MVNVNLYSAIVTMSLMRWAEYNALNKLVAREKEGFHDS